MMSNVKLDGIIAAPRPGSRPATCQTKLPPPPPELILAHSLFKDTLPDNSGGLTALHVKPEADVQHPLVTHRLRHIPSTELLLMPEGYTLPATMDMLPEENE